MVTFHGDYRPRTTTRTSDHHIDVTETAKPVPNRLYPDEREIFDGQDRPGRVIPARMVITEPRNASQAAARHPSVHSVCGRRDVPGGFLS